eukprot:947894-Pelagomonas_calceolata.AAC.5
MRDGGCLYLLVAHACCCQRGGGERVWQLALCARLALCPKQAWHTPALIPFPAAACASCAAACTTCAAACSTHAARRVTELPLLLLTLGGAA